MKTKRRYWLVGAYWDDKDDYTDVFVAAGYWQMGYSDQQKPEYARLRRSMKKNDRIAIKARGGKGKSHLIIKAIGIVQAMEPQDDGRVWVRWVLTDQARKVESKGKFSTIHGPLDPSRDADWIHEIFTL